VADWRIAPAPVDRELESVIVPAVADQATGSQIVLPLAGRASAPVLAPARLPAQVLHYCRD
jgi:hypothetical protein